MLKRNIKIKFSLLSGTEALFVYITWNLQTILVHLLFPFLLLRLRQRQAQPGTGHGKQFTNVTIHPPFPLPSLGEVITVVFKCQSLFMFGVLGIRGQKCRFLWNPTEKVWGVDAAGVGDGKEPVFSPGCSDDLLALLDQRLSLVLLASSHFSSALGPFSQATCTAIRAPSVHELGLNCLEQSGLK